ncbi:MAG: choice-of-anchor I family protein [Bacteroidetes bacterium]|nr:choice-of-anchor I family protein [Bacteroidota bacterium]
MRISFLLSSFLLGTLICKAQFTNGNLAFLQADASASNTTCSIIEINKTAAGQSAITTFPIDGTGASALRFSGSATSTAYLSHSNDGTLLCFNGANNTNTASNVNTLNPRGVGTLNAAQTFNLATTYTGSSGNQTRSSSTIDNSSWFIADQGGLYTNGTSSASPSGNFRGIKPFGGTMYLGQASGTVTTIQVSTISATSGGTLTGLPGLTNNAALQDFYLISSGTNGTAFDILYVLSATSNTAGTIAKYSLVSGTWTANGTYTTTFGGFGLAAEVNGGGANLYVSTGLGALTANSVLRVNDVAGYNATISITTGNNVNLYTAPAGKIIKGIDFVPVTPPVTPSVNLSVSSNTGSEAAATVITVTATATSPVSGNKTIDLSVSGTNITAGDYTLSNTVITILNGQTTGSVTFTITDDAVVEGTETANLTISNPSAGIVLGTTVSQSVTITDNDVALPSVNLSVSINTASEAAPALITVTATASAPVSGNQTVSLAVSGTGITATDYLLSGTTITIANGLSTGSVTFIARNDAETEGTETALLTISNPSTGISLGATTTQNITITDNTCQPLLRKSTATSANGAEISAFDQASGRVFTVAGPAMEYYTLSAAGILTGPVNMPFGFTPPAGTNALPNSVTIRNGIVAVSYAIVNSTTNAQNPGRVAFYDAATAAYINDVTVGYLPDMVIYTPDGTKLLTANEGEPNSYGQGTSFDPEGSVSVIDISGGVPAATVTTAGFTSFNGQVAALRAAGIRIFGPGATVAQDLEPEYIAFSADGTKAYITLQENNAVAEMDIATVTITQLLPLGLKDHSLTGNGLDASDQDGGINIANWPIKGMYMPDAISGFTVGGNHYFITANEGDSRAYTGYSEEIRVGNAAYTLDPTVFPNAATLKLNTNLGRLQLSNATGDTDGDGDFDEIHALGARSFSIWNSSFVRVFDSGDQLELITKNLTPATFNSEGATGTFDTRSDNKGPEPEAATTGSVNGVLYAFVGSERTGDIFVYDITNPLAPVFKQYIDNPADLGVEGLIFIPANQSPTGKALIIASAEVSRTVTVYEFSLVSQQLASTNTSATIVQEALTSYGDCSGIIASVLQSGASPAAGSVTAKVWIEGTQAPDFVKRHYEITPATNAATATGTVTLYFTQQEFDDFNAVNTVKLPQNSGDAAGKANLLVVKYPGVSNDGTGLPGTYTGTATTINPDDNNIIWNSAASRWEVSFDVTGFSGFFVKTIGGTLPVNWITVSGTLNSNKQPVLKWKVQESNVVGYTIEKSLNGISFSPAGSISSSGDGVHDYLFTENSSLAGTAWYRIRQTGLDGRVSYSVIIKLNTAADLITIYPNPVKDKLVMNIPPSLHHTMIKLYNAAGKLQAQWQLTAQSNTLDVNHLANGVYLLHFSDGTSMKFMKQ